MEKSHKDIWFVIGMVIMIVFAWVILYWQGYLDNKLPQPVQQKTISKIDDKIIDVTKKIMNRDKDEYIKTDSGLEYKIIKTGNGEKPVCNTEKCDTVEVHYEGRLENGEVFDSSYKRGEKISFPLNHVIKGWTEGLQLMPVGSEFEFKIPPELAYGSHALPGIPANSTLIFKVELFDIK